MPKPDEVQAPLPIPARAAALHVARAIARLASLQAKIAGPPQVPLPASHVREALAMAAIPARPTIPAPPATRPAPPVLQGKMPAPAARGLRPLLAKVLQPAAALAAAPPLPPPVELKAVEVKAVDRQLSAAELVQSVEAELQRWATPEHRAKEVFTTGHGGPRAETDPNTFVTLADYNTAYEKLKTDKGNYKTPFNSVILYVHPCISKSGGGKVRDLVLCDIARPGGNRMIYHIMVKG